jgi:acyl-CoA synthetase (AMP-forming)/AMP-acid ligase II
MLTSWIPTEPAARAGANALRLLISGSAALSTPIRNRFAEITGHILLERYGMTEIGMGISCGLDPNKRPDGSVGWPLPGVGVRLVDQESGIVIDSADEDGMIEIKGHNVFLEYWKQSAQTAKEFTRDGWFKTGDIARRDRTGAYFIQGRESVDVIKSGGYKISALEVERTMLTLESIQEVVVVGVTDEEWGQRVAAMVRQIPGVRTLLSLQASPVAALLKAWANQE